MRRPTRAKRSLRVRGVTVQHWAYGTGSRRVVTPVARGIPSIRCASGLRTLARLEAVAEVRVSVLQPPRDACREAVGSWHGLAAPAHARGGARESESSGGATQMRRDKAVEERKEGRRRREATAWRRLFDRAARTCS